MATSRSTSSGRFPLNPLASTLARNSSMARASASDSGLPTPAAWLRTRLVCNCARLSCGIRTSASLPKPVFTPYTVCPAASIRSIIARLAAMRAPAPRRYSTRQPSSETASISARLRRLAVQNHNFHETDARRLHALPYRRNPHLIRVGIKSTIIGLWQWIPRPCWIAMAESCLKSCRQRPP